MKQSRLFSKTRKEAPKDEVSKNAQLLIRAGFVHKEMAGVYTFLPLGLRVLEKIKQIIREELNKVGGQEMKMTALQTKDVWEKTDRWREDLDDGIWFRTHLNNETELGLAFTHEEALTNIMANFVSSYKDLPIYAYQFQTKFRNELRAKSGLLRGREFLMKDLYDFSLDEKQHKEFYERMKDVYKKIFNRLGIGDRTFLTISNGGTFSKYSFEFQTVCDAGEDILVLDEEKGVAINKDDFNDEVCKDFNIKKEDYNFVEKKSAEVGDIYNLGEKYAKAIGLTYKDKDGKDKPVFMGSYGMGVPRIMAVITELFSDENGIIWPEAVAPYKVHLISINKNEEAEKIYRELEQSGIEVLFDDREDVAPGEKFADADLIGCPYRLVVSAKTLKEDSVEIKRRDSDKTKLIEIGKLIKNLNN
ncbi:His/Gly/Thr/Pro-type tRNA ligase C-terminal domain-containing protein [Candidatus Marithioploca araucensis]|uniref:Proline--tRNA ligase n=1 Tax=Candidatus Marithioploca araucensis TaxID=70273 RepID=A0ABT7VT36_9GAMM|nr:His/Gly/Thr/Pro-type tRNA ligase C-terminal domain-containing protein [Candidatus Marithioploca araucensis]